MILWKSENLLNISTSRELPEGVIQGLFIRYAGIAAAAQTVALADLGTVRVNMRGNDIVNTPASFFSLFDNLHWGVIEATSNVGGAFAFSIYVPFHQFWDTDNGLLVQKEDLSFFELRFPAMIAALIASGTVTVNYIKAKAATSYVPLYMQQNVQVGGAGQVTDRLQQFNVSSIYIISNANLTNILVFRDGQIMISSDQNTLLAASNFNNRVETATTLYQIDLNSTRNTKTALANLIELILTATAATSIQLFYNSILFDNRFGSVSVTEKYLPPNKKPLLIAD